MLLELLGLRRKHPTLKNTRSVANLLATYFGTHRQEPMRGDPRVWAHVVLQLLANIPGRGAYLLRTCAEEAISRGAFPDRLFSESETYKLISESIGEVCKRLSK